jgi:hypothetical protein
VSVKREAPPVADIGYTGRVIPELEGGDEAYLRDVSNRIDRLLLS